MSWRLFLLISSAFVCVSGVQPELLIVFTKPAVENAEERPDPRADSKGAGDDTDEDSDDGGLDAEKLAALAEEEMAARAAAAADSDDDDDYVQVASRVGTSADA